MPEVSIIMPCLNSSKYIETALKSVLNQSFRSWELIVVDNGSTDSSLDIAERFRLFDSRIRVLVCDRKGCACARNLGIDNAHGEYICFLDSDDYWSEKKLEIQMNEIKAKGGVFCCADYYVCNENGEPKRIQRGNWPLTFRGLLYKKNVVGCLTVMFNRKVFPKFYFDENMKLNEDYDLWLTMLKYIESNSLQVACISVPIAFYRVHDGGKSKNKIRTFSAKWKIFYKFTGNSYMKSVICLISVFFNGIIQRFTNRDFVTDKRVNVDLESEIIESSEQQ
jgi:teichuronic acid biosynthesis glycosyltransferase TuaG